jgi:hypothetical protein
MVILGSSLKSELGGGGEDKGRRLLPCAGLLLIKESDNNCSCSSTARFSPVNCLRSRDSPGFPLLFLGAILLASVGLISPPSGPTATWALGHTS